MTPSLYLSLTGSAFNGKKLAQPQINLLNKLGGMGWEIGPCVKGGVAGAPVRVMNRNSGFEGDLDPLIASLVNWVYDTYATYDRTGAMNYAGTKVAIGTFDRVRMLVLSLDSKAYYNFLD